MRFLSVCSGIEAASCAWHPLGWEAAWYSEIEAFPSAVLAHHYPNTPNHGDMTKFQEWPDAAIDLLVGGTPCQSFSVAGLRKGLADPRGNLMLTYLAIADRYRPRWLVWENVPGVLSSNGGRDFGTLLGGLGQLGYGFAYRVLDAQFFGVPQRRRRVFVVGCLGDWRSAAAVLFERHSLQGHPAPRRQTGEGITASPGGIAGNVSSKWSKGTGGPAGDEHYNLITGAITARSGRNAGLANDSVDAGHLIAHSLRGEGFDASEDGAGRGTPLVPVPFDTTQITCAANYSNPQAGDPCHPLAAGAHPPAVAFGFNWQNAGGYGNANEGLGITEEGTGPLQRCQTPAVAVQASQSGIRMNETVGTLDANYGSRRHNGVMTTTQVRRLTPRECERLQGFPDDYTLIPVKRVSKARLQSIKTNADGVEKYVEIDGEVWQLAADGPRYKALGNSMAVPCMAWIGERVARVDAITKSRQAA